jgi:hypothetical protein
VCAVRHGGRGSGWVLKSSVESLGSGSEEYICSPTMHFKIDVQLEPDSSADVRSLKRAARDR